jgi:putative nucleotidyltransferase with HDIG domain
MNMPIIRLDRSMVAELSANIPALPKVALQLLALLDDDEGNLHLLVDQARHDPVISSRLLGLANSAGLRASGRDCKDIRSAMAMLGLSRVRLLVLSLSVRGAFEKLSSGAQAAEFWQHSVDVGVCAQVLAEHFELHGELAYICGLVHDVGRLWLAHNFPDAYDVFVGPFGDRGNRGEIDAERQAFGIDHAQIGDVLGEVWDLPPVIRQTILDHHGSPAMADEPLVVLIHLAEAICQALHPNGYPIAYLSPLIESVIHPDWEHMAHIYGEIEARARVAKAEIQALAG